MGTTDRRATLRDAALRATVPAAIVGAVSAGLTGPLDPAAAEPRPPERPRPTLPAPGPGALRPAALVVRTVLPAPAAYTVVSGDTVAAIAERFGLSTASVLAMNGLGWSSLIHPGQVLRLSAASAPPAPTQAPTQPIAPGTHTVARGDTMSAIAARYGVATAALLAANGLSWSSIIYPGQRLAVPAPSPMRIASAVTPAAPAAPASASYTVRSGDTVSGIARAHGVPTTAVQAANALTGSSIIRPGQVLAIPGASSPAVAVAVGLGPDAAANARIVIRTGRALGVPDRGIVIALAAAAQESSLANLPYGDRDSVGLFQQRPSRGWGTRAQLLDPGYAARLFYGGPGNPNAGRTRGLLDIPGWQGMSVTGAAQAVQISAYPDRYARWEAPAASWLAALG